MRKLAEVDGSRKFPSCGLIRNTYNQCSGGLGWGGAGWREGGKPFPQLIMPSIIVSINIRRFSRYVIVNSYPYP